MMTTMMMRRNVLLVERRVRMMTTMMMRRSVLLVERRDP
jgi:hypothetical protein